MQVSVAGIGQTPVGEHWDKGVRELAAEALLSALQDAHVDQVDALYVGNMLSGELVEQEHLGALVADALGLQGVQAFKVEAGGSSGGAAVHAGYLAIVSGQSDRVAVVGVEKTTDAHPRAVTRALALELDGEYESPNGITFDSLNALLMRRYMHEFDLIEEDFACFPMNAHRNAQTNPYAMFRRPITRDAYRKAKKVARPISVLDSAPVCDGAAAVILCRTDRLNGNGARAVSVRASTVATETVSLHSRLDPLWLGAVETACNKAYAMAQVQPGDIDLFELHDATTLLAPMSLEAAGLTPRGTGVYAARDGEIGIAGRIPISTLGGLKARGHPVGASGVYQIAECVQQLRGEAGANQVPNARVAMAQSLGGMAATAVTHILIK
jgi:acetyl-CoA C-acetyltransferase